MYQKLTLTQSISMLTVLSGAFAAEPVVHEILLILYWRHHQLHHRLEYPRRWQGQRHLTRYLLIAAVAVAVAVAVAAPYSHKQK